MTSSVIESGKTVGILGAGQLGKMSLIAAAQLGYHTVVWHPEGDIPAMEMATHRITNPFTDKKGFQAFCRLADVVTTEWENIPVPLLEALEEEGKLVRPSSTVLRIAQSRIAEKTFAHELGVRTAQWEQVTTEGFLDREGELDNEAFSFLLPGILKTDRNGYDGKGQWHVDSVESLAVAYEQAGVSCVLEQKLQLDFELSIIVARNARGEIKFSNVVMNTHREGILDVTIWSPETDASQWEQAVQRTATSFAEALKLEGILAFEFFVAEGKLYFNEMAPRPHNSFHGSIEAAYTSQFEQHIRAICNLPLGNLTFHSPFTMKNLIGGDYTQWSQHLEHPNARLHLYGKNESRPGRKMGHVTTLKK